MAPKGSKLQRHGMPLSNSAQNGPRVEEADIILVRLCATAIGLAKWGGPHKAARTQGCRVIN